MVDEESLLCEDVTLLRTPEYKLDEYLEDEVTLDSEGARDTLADSVGVSPVRR